MAVPTLNDDSTEAEDRRLKYKTLVDYEIAMTQMRFQTLAIFLAAVGFIVGLGHYSRWVGALLLSITLGLWIIDLRSRDMLSKFRDWGDAVEDGHPARPGEPTVSRSDRSGAGGEIRTLLFEALDDPRPGPTPGRIPARNRHHFLGRDRLCDRSSLRRDSLSLETGRPDVRGLTVDEAGR